jgi:dimethylamine/trimethylamine dehydrogenase
MPCDPRHAILFEPVRIGPKELRNRFYQVPHCSGFGSRKPGTQARFRGMKAEGGWAAVCTEFCSIGPVSDSWPHISARLWDEDDVRNLSVMTDAVHEHGSLAGVELWHGGAYSPGADARSVAVAPSQIPSGSLYAGFLTTPKEMSIQDIQEVHKLYREAAQRARRAGFDIVYAYGGHGYLFSQFLSPYFNKRTDEYGGSFENRARIWLECLEVIREEIGDDCAITTRMALNSSSETDEGLQFIELADHLVDLWDVTVSPDDKDVAPSRFFGENSHREWVSKVRAHTSKPIVGVGRLVNPDVMVEAVRSGQLDIIGAARPSIADPFLPTKIEEGRLDDIRECTGSNICAARVLEAGHLVCMQNPTSGEEYRRGWHPERYTRASNAERDVLVIGGGPAGMECAMVLGKRGMRRVHLVEATPEIGGSAAMVARLPNLGEWARVVNHRKIQLDKLKNVEVITGAKLTPQEVREYGAEIVVCATGARYARDGLSNATNSPIPGVAPQPAVERVEGVERQRVFTPEDILNDGQLPTSGGRVVVYDCEGYVMGPGLAELLAGSGHDVVLITPLVQVSPYLDVTAEGPRLRAQLYKMGVDMRTQTIVTAAEQDSVLLQHDYGTEENLSADALVLVTARLSNATLRDELLADPAALEQEGIEAVYGIGDCIAPRQIGENIFDGHRLAREIDTPNPEVPLPYIRERQVFGAATIDPAVALTLR